MIRGILPNMWFEKFHEVQWITPVMMFLFILKQHSSAVTFQRILLNMPEQFYRWQNQKKFFMWPILKCFWLYLNSRPSPIIYFITRSGEFFVHSRIDLVTFWICFGTFYWWPLANSMVAYYTLFFYKQRINLENNSAVNKTGNMKQLTLTKDIPGNHTV